MRSNNLSRHLKPFVAIGTLVFVGSAYAANWYVRPSSAGANTGADWNNAWSNSSIAWANVAAGDTIWLAGGTYSDLFIVGASGASSNPIKVLRVRSTDSVPVAAPGWNPSFDSQVVINSQNWPQIWIKGPNHDITIDGRIMSGILLQGPTNGGDNFRTGGSGDVSNLYVSHLEVVGSSNTTSLTGGRYGFNLVPGQFSNSTLSNCTIDHCIVHQINEAFRANGWNGVTIQYCSIYDTTLDNLDHNDFCYSAGYIVNTIWRYNTFYNSPSDGLLFESDTQLTGFYFYGNVCYNCVYAIIQTKTSTNAQTLYFYNNVFGGVGSGGSSYAWLSLQGTCSGCQIYDNIFYNSQNQYPGGVSSDYNAYYPGVVSGVPRPSGESHSITLATNPFVNAAGGDFYLTSAGASTLAHGTPLLVNGFINKDMDGNIRGVGAWGVGAYVGTPTPPAATPPPPADLRITGSK